MVDEQGEAAQTGAIDVAANLAAVRANIQTACEQAKRDPAEVSLIAVSKAQPLERLEAALAAGQRIFGENYVQEAQARWPDLRARYPDAEVHMIGALQTNKAREAVATFDIIQSVDRPRLAAALAKEMQRSARKIRVFVQVNTGEEDQKAGAWPADADAFIDTCKSEHGLDVQGLMAIPPADEEIALHAMLLGKIAARNGLTALSIGMSADYQKAIAVGATHVRVGTAIFGPRPPKV